MSTYTCNDGSENVDGSHFPLQGPVTNSNACCIFKLDERSNTKPNLEVLVYLLESAYLGARGVFISIRLRTYMGEAASAATGNNILQARGSLRARGPGCMKTSPSETQWENGWARKATWSCLERALWSPHPGKSTTYSGNYVSKGLNHTEKCCCCPETSPKCVRVDGSHTRLTVEQRPW